LDKDIAEPFCRRTLDPIWIRLASAGIPAIMARRFCRGAENAQGVSMTIVAAPEIR
jgi:hypothetical protein